MDVGGDSHLDPAPCEHGRSPPEHERPASGMNSSSPPARLRPFRPVPFGRYTLLSQLATGGMGEIFLARLEGAQGFEKLCVIKKILPQLAADREFVERFVGEARTLVKLSHGSIAQVLDMGLHEGEAYMALEYVDGKDLRKVAGRARDRQKPLPLTFVLFVMGRVLDALAYAHRKKGDDEGELNLVHRDISPQNLLISYEGEVKVIDFGLAKSRLSAAKTNPSIILGKFLYMSPEQARHQPVDRRGDLYAVGLCLYELLSGKNPFDAVPPGELMSAVAQPNIPPLGEVLPFAPPAVAQLVMKALAVDPAQRFQTAEEFRGRLMGCLLEVDPSAGPESVSRYMHELFAPEYQAERRLIASLKEVARAPEPESVGSEAPEVAIEPLSFKPTPRTRDGGSVRDDGETRPGTVVDETTRAAPAPVLPAEAGSGARRPSTGTTGARAAMAPALAPEAGSGARRTPTGTTGPRPAVSPALPSEMRSGARRALAAEPGSSGGSSPQTRGPVSTAMPRASAQHGALTTREPPMPPETVPIENTPIWSERLRTSEELAAIEPPQDKPGEVPWESQDEADSTAELGNELADTDEQAGVDVRLDDTDPRIQMPRVSHADTQPRVSRADVYRQEPEQEQEELSQSGRSKPGGARVPRRRGTSPSSPAIASRVTSSGKLVALAAQDGAPDEAAAREAPLRTASPKQPASSWMWLMMALGVLLLGSGVAIFAFVLNHKPEPARPPPARPLFPSGNKAGQGSSAPTVAAAQPRTQPSSEPTPSEPTPAEPSTPADSAQAVVVDAGVPEMTASAEGEAVPVAPEAAGAAVAQAEPAPTPDPALLEPLAPESTVTQPTVTPPTPPKRTSVRKRPSRNQSNLQREWTRTRTDWKSLTKVYGCESLDFLCTRYEDVEAEVVGMGDVENAALLAKVKALHRDILKRKNGS